ncbi:hypothetical protein ACE38U_09155 [Cedecea sp. S5-13]|uniref:hypothetical protein n=1 Tax=Cedecea selenatireducens TaxID=3144416 RepID=UPI0035CCD485
MATVGQNLQANIKFGGNIDPSWSKSVSGLKDGLKGVEKQSKTLTSQQEKLAKKIKEGVLAGKNVAEMRKQYDKLTRQIQRATNEQEGMNKALKRAERMDHWKGRGRAAAGKAGGMMGGLARWGSAGIIAGAAGALASPIALNQETAEQAGLARSYGVDIGTYKAWDGIGKQAGLNGENVGDLFEEYKNKVSDYMEDPTKGALHDALPALGFKAGDLAGMNNQQQGEEVIKRLMNMKDEQRSAGLADAIFGGEGNKLLTFMRLSGKSYKDLMDEQHRYNMVTQEGADGAVEGNMAFNNLWTVFTTGAQEIAGAIGGELSPKIREVSDDLAAWFKGGGINKVKTMLMEDIYPAIASFIKGVIYVGKVIYAVAEKLSWLLPDEKEIQDKKQKLLTQVAAGNSSPEMIGAMAEDMDLGDWYKKTITPEKTRQLRAQWQLSKSTTGGTASAEEQQKLMDIVDPAAGGSGGFDALLNQGKGPSLGDALEGTSGTGGRGTMQLNQDNKTTIEIYQQPGESQDALAQRIAETNRSQDMYNGHNIMGDMIEGWG